MDVGHIALVARHHHVIFPRAGAALVPRVLALTVQRHKPILPVKLGIVKTRAGKPGNGAALSGRQTFDGVKGKGGKIGKAPAHHTAARSAQSVSRVCDHYRAVPKHLHIRAGTVKTLFRIKHRKNAVVIAKPAADIHRNDRFRALGKSGGKGVTVHFIAFRSAIDHNDACADMSNYLRSGGVGVSGKHYLVSLSHTEQPERQLCGGSL